MSHRATELGLRRINKLRERKVHLKKARLPPEQGHYNMDDRGLNLTNRRGTKICEKFQTGECQGRGNVCPLDPTKSHQCAKCLQYGHGAKDCTSEKGKGRGKGKKKGKRTQW